MNEAFRSLIDRHQAGPLARRHSKDGIYVRHHEKNERKVLEFKLREVDKSDSMETFPSIVGVVRSKPQDSPYWASAEAKAKDQSS